MTKIIKVIILTLSIVLPFQTIISQIVINLWRLPESINLWKEVFVATLILYLSYQIFQNLRQNTSLSFVTRSQRHWSLILMIILTGWIIISSFLINQIPVQVFVIGFRFELWWLWFFVLAHNWLLTKPFEGNKKLDWVRFGSNLNKAILTGLFLVIVLGLGILSLGPKTVLPSLGFSATPNEVSPPICHLIDFNQTGCRLAAGFSSPNHLAAYLILVLPVILVGLMNAKNLIYKLIFGIIAVLVLVFIALSYARFSWLVVSASFGIILIMLIKSRVGIINFKLQTLFKTLLGISLLMPVLIGIFTINLPPSTLASLPAGLAKPSSTALHYMHTMSSIDLLKENPQEILTGFGVGSSGPAAKEIYYNIYQARIIRDNGVIPYRWGLVERDLTIPESWYLQLIINGGIFYALAYLLILMIPIRPLQVMFSKVQIQWPEMLVALAFFGVIVGNLFLHLWESQNVALYGTIIWIWLGLYRFDTNNQNK